MRVANGQDGFDRALRSVVRAALREDIRSGDVSSSFFGAGERGTARLLAKDDGVLSGGYVLGVLFPMLDRTCSVRLLKRDGERFEPGEVLAEMCGPLRCLFAGERVALNFMQRLCGVATLTRQFVDAVGSSRIAVVDTRKTTPLLRVLEKRAVVDGGGKNHRFALDDMAMLKNNHADAAGGLETAVARLKATGVFRRNPSLPMCIEARNLDEAMAALAARPQIVMLDNMAVADIRPTVARMKRWAASHGVSMPQIEISGGITLETIALYRRLPIDRISIGAITHSVPAIDLSLRIVADAPGQGAA